MATSDNTTTSNTLSTSIRVNLVNYEMSFNDGILSKYARNMKEELDKLGIENVITDRPLEGYINHHINYLQYPKHKSVGKNTLMITHIFEGHKMNAVKEAMKTAEVGICMSQETKDQLSGIGKLEVILPAHDMLPRKKKKIAVVTNVYPDGCKREKMFYELLWFLEDNDIMDRFEFQVMGKDWHLDEFNLEYYDSFDHGNYLKILDACDYLLYFGLDEGAMSVLDARQVGLKTIAPLVGFHREIGIDYPFLTQGELNNIFLELSKNPVENLNWSNYIKQHIKIWERLR